MADIVSVPPPACDQPGRQSWDHPVTESIPDNGWRSAAARDGHYVSSVLEGGRSLSQRRHALTTQLVKPGEATAQGQDQPLDGAGDLSAIAR